MIKANTTAKGAIQQDNFSHEVSKFGSKKFWVKKILSKKILPEDFVLSRKNVQKFWPKKDFWSKKDVWLKKFLVQKNI